MPAGNFTVVVRLVGYHPNVTSVTLAPGETRELTILLARGAVILDPLVVTASRTEELLLGVPVAVSVVEQERLERQTALTTIEYLAVLPEAQVLSGGLMTRRYTTRGPNFGSSANVRTMTDFRYTTIPGINANADYIVSTTVEDIARVELIRGQATVQYGPNSSRGALNLITRSPLDDRGTAVVVAGGTRSTVQATVRHASALSENVGVKITGEYFEGDDWLPPDVAPDSMIGSQRLDFSQRIRVDARVDWLPDAQTRAMFAGGVAQATVLDAVTYGGTTAYIKDGRMWYLQGRVTRGRFSANVFLNKIDLKDASFPGIGLQFKDRSYDFWAQIQHGTQMGSRTSLIYGADLGRTVPQSDSTLYGAWEGQADLTELGAFLSATTRLSHKFDVMLAARADYHSLIGNSAVSPWASVTYYPQPSHAIRLGASRSFSTPGSIDLFADFTVSKLGPLPYYVRFAGGGPGRTFRRDCGGLCMRSPFNPAGAGGPSQYLLADATTQWAAAVAFLQLQGIDLSGIPAPDSTQVSSVLATLNTQTQMFDPSTSDDVIDAGGPERRWITQLELGYKGLINDRIRVGADVYYRENNQIAGQQQIVTPNVFFDQASLEAYLAQFMAAGQAGQIAAELSAIPVGTITPEEATTPTDLQLGQNRVAGINYWGAALDLEVAVTSELSARAAYTYVSEDVIFGEQDAVVVFNNPKNQFMLGVDYVNNRIGFNATLQGRHLESYPGANGPSRAQIPSYTLIDAVLGYRIPGSSVALTLTAYNVFNDVHQELPGAAAIGRLVIGGVRAVF